MASGDVALELVTTSISRDATGPRPDIGGIRQETVFNATRSEPRVGGFTTFTYSVDLTRDANEGIRQETLFDASKQYKITFTEV